MHAFPRQLLIVAVVVSHRAYHALEVGLPDVHLGLPGDCHLAGSHPESESEDCPAAVSLLQRHMLLHEPAAGKAVARATVYRGPNAAAELDMISFLETSREVLHSTARVATPGGANVPAHPRGEFENLGSSLDALIGDTEKAILHADTGSMQLRNLYANIHAKMNSFNPAFMMDLRAEAPRLLHDIRVNSGLRGPIHMLHYPSVHLAPHKAIPVAGNKLSPPLAAFAAKTSFFMNDYMFVCVVSFVLIALSTFFDLRRKKDEGSGKQKQFEHADMHRASSSDSSRLSISEGTVTTLSSILGTGAFCLPYAMSLSGWIGMPLMVFFTGCTSYTAHLLSWSLLQQFGNDDVGGTKVPPGWGALLGTVFGQRAEHAVNVFLVVELWGYVLSGIVATSMCLNQLADDLSVSSAIGLTVVVQFILTTIPMKTLSRVNMICNALFITCCFMFIVTGLLLPVKAPASDFKFVKREGILAACGIMVFSPASHSLFPSIMMRMERPSEYPICIRRAYSFACLGYIILAVPGYYLFGNVLQSSAVANIGVDRNLIAIPNLGWMNDVAAFCMMMKISGLQPLILTPLNSTIESMVSGYAPGSVSTILVPPVVLTISAVVASHFADKIGALLNLIGSTFCMTIAFILPVLCYWKMNNEHVGCLQKVAFSGLIVMGGIFVLVGLITAFDT